MVIEDLHSGTQRHLMGHTEEISTLALQHDGLILASASGPSDTTASQICLWNLKDGVCKKVFIINLLFLFYWKSTDNCIFYLLLYSTVLIWEMGYFRKYSSTSSRNVTSV